jgi:hypothetical protein
VEVAFHLGHADGQKALAFIAQFQHRAIVHHHRPAQLKVVGHPLLARGQLGRACQQRGADGLTSGQAQQGIGLSAPGDDRAGATAGRSLGRQYLGEHATPA